MKFFLLFTGFLFSLSVNAQRTVQGQVLHQLTAVPVAGATIMAGSSAAVLSDQQGKFSLLTAADSIQVTAIGYEKKTD